MCDEFIEETKTVPTSLNEERKFQNLSIYLDLLITIALLIAVNIYCYLIKYWTKQKHLIPFHITNNKLRDVLYLKMYYKNGK